MTTDRNENIIIIGGGLAGLTAARKLHENNIEFTLLEASDRIGGKLKTDVVDGFLLDHGFQIFLNAYPEVKKWLDLDKLNLQAFSSGARLLFSDGTQETIADPLRHPKFLFQTLFAKSSNFKDKMGILSLKNKLKNTSVDEIFAQDQISTLEALKHTYGFSNRIISQFFQPFFSGIFFENELETSNLMFEFLFKMFSEGDACLPANGMAEIPKSLAAPINKDKIWCNCRVDAIDKGKVVLEDGSVLGAEKIILATHAMTNISGLELPKAQYLPCKQIHFICNEPPSLGKFIALNTNKYKSFNNCCVLNNIASNYAPQGKYLVSVSINESQYSSKELELQVKSDLSLWFGKSVENWECLHQRDILHALPSQKRVNNRLSKDSFKLNDSTYICGDYIYNGSINGAMKAGEDVVNTVLNN